MMTLAPLKQSDHVRAMQWWIDCAKRERAARPYRGIPQCVTDMHAWYRKVDVCARDALVCSIPSVLIGLCAEYYNPLSVPIPHSGFPDACDTVLFEYSTEGFYRWSVDGHGRFGYSRETELQLQEIVQEGVYRYNLQEANVADLLVEPRCLVCWRDYTAAIAYNDRHPPAKDSVDADKVAKMLAELGFAEGCSIGCSEGCSKLGGPFKVADCVKRGWFERDDAHVIIRGYVSEEDSGSSSEDDDDDNDELPGHAEPRTLWTVKYEAEQRQREAKEDARCLKQQRARVQRTRRLPGPMQVATRSMTAADRRRAISAVHPMRAPRARSRSRSRVRRSGGDETTNSNSNSNSNGSRERSPRGRSPPVVVLTSFDARE